MKTIAQQLNIKDFPFEIKDKNGNVLYYEDSTAFWFKYERDEKGNVLYCEDSNGYWSRRERDEKGRETYCEDSYGFWCKRERDENGREIYYENSNGIIQDNRPKTCNNKVVEIDGKKYKLTEL